MRDSSLYIKDILAAIESIETFIGAMDFEAFQADDKTQSAVIRKLEVIGEAVKQIPEEIRRQASLDSLETGRRYARQADPFLFWDGRPSGLADDQKEAARPQGIPSRQNLTSFFQGCPSTSRPHFQLQPFDLLGVAPIDGDDRMVKGNGGGGDDQIVGAEGVAFHHLPAQEKKLTTPNADRCPAH